MYRCDTTALLWPYIATGEHVAICIPPDFAESCKSLDVNVWLEQNAASTSLRTLQPAMETSASESGSQVAAGGTNNLDVWSNSDAES